MENIILSTAAFCLWNISPAEKLKICRQLEFKRIEVALSTEKMARDFLGHLDLSLDIDPFGKIAVHAPWRGIVYGENARTRRVLDYMNLIAQKVPVEVFIFRIDCIADLAPIIGSGLPVCLENSDRVGSWEKIRKVAEKSDLPLALNINRAVRGYDYLDEMITEFGHRISRIQVSGYNVQHGRMPIISAKQLHVLEKIKGIRAPLILEGLFDPGDTEAIVQERRAVWEYINESVELSPPRRGA
jgi:hypothetical protein